MACYIASSDNRIYAALESSFGAVAAATAAERIPAVRLAVRQQVEQPRRRDKTGGRTFPGMPAGFRRRTSFDLTTYLTQWAAAESAPCYAALFQAALGGGGLVYAGGTVASVPDPLHLAFSAPHGLVPGQAIRIGGEIRFAVAIVDASTVVINAPFTATPTAGAAIGRTITYLPATGLPSASIYDYWSPAEAVQRVLGGSAVDRLRVRVNGDFHQFSFSGEAADLIDSVSFTSGQGGLTAFPDEPVLSGENFSLVPGTMGQAWFGTAPSQFHTVLSADVTLDNNIDLRNREFGRPSAACLAAGERRVTVDMELVSNDHPETNELYQAAAQRSPIGVMFQLGETAEHLCGVWLGQVIPEIPLFEDDETRLRWRFRDSRAQGAVNDEIAVAFA